MKKYTIDKVFHGTGAVFDRFQCPAYFAETMDTAEFFARRSKCKSIILTCQILFKNPLIVDMKCQSWGGFHLQDKQLEEACIEFVSEGNLDEKEYFQEEGLTIGFLADYAENKGYDGIIAMHCMEENNNIETQYVVLDSNNISIKKVNILNC